VSARDGWERVVRVTRRHRAPLAGLCAAGAVLTALPLVAPPAEATTPVLTAAHDLAPGAPLGDADLTVVDLPSRVVPAGALADLADAVGRFVTGPVRRGETLTDVRLLGSSLLKDRGLVATPVRLADPATVALLHAGDRVDVLAAATDDGHAGQPAVTVASGLQVLAVPEQADGVDGGLLVLAATPAIAARLASAAVDARLSVTVLAQ
jgi:pilus assembly protein CpaB